MKTDGFFSTIISTSRLYENLDSAGWVIIDCRHDLARPDWGQAEYQKGHIPGADFAHLDHDLSGPITPQTSRHPLPEIDRIAERLSSWGIGDDTQVVVYDGSGGAIAVRLWWQLRFLGHQNTALLDGGYTQWLKDGYPVATNIAKRPAQKFNPRPQSNMLVDQRLIEENLRSPSFLLIDARAEERYRGEKEPIDPVAGHIPGAINRFHGANLGADGLFLPAVELREQFSTLLAGKPPEEAVLYCGSGVTSCHHLLAMEIAGLPGAKLYAGSWSEWIRDPRHPIARA
jgi:thiosulfate/3-mercaptopyruvate sulfurtransferase